MFFLRIILLILPMNSIQGITLFINNSTQEKAFASLSSDENSIFLTENITITNKTPLLKSSTIRYFLPSQGILSYFLR